MNDKSVVFIDGGYLSKLTRHHFIHKDGSPKKIDFIKFGYVIASKCKSELIRTYYYDCPPYNQPSTNS